MPLMKKLPSPQAMTILLGRTRSLTHSAGPDDGSRARAVDLDACQAGYHFVSLDIAIGRAR